MARMLAHYEIISPLGRGGMGEVHLARDTKLDRVVAIKVLPADYAHDPERRRRFAREAKALAALQHPNIVTIFSVEESDGVPFLVMEHVQGRALSEVMGETGVPLDETLRLMIPVADAISAAHARGITHRDVKPDNIMVGDDGRVRVLDFGLATWFQPAQGLGNDPAARTISTDSMTQEGRVVGTVAYMSPEQAQGKPVDQRSDVFSFGIVLYELTTGRRPFVGETAIDTISSILKDEPTPVTDLDATLPRHLDRITRRCLAKEENRRYQSAVDLRNELEGLQEEIAAERSSTGVSPSPEGPSTAKTRRPWTAIAGALIVLLAVVIFWTIRRGSDQDGATATGIGASGRPTIAVVTFEDHSGSEDIRWLATGLPSMLLTSLAQTPGLDVISSQRIQEILRQVGQESVDAIDRATLAEVGRRSGAGAVVVGSIYRAGDDIRIDVQVEDPATGRLVLGRQVVGQDVFPMVDELARHIRSGLDLEPSETIPSVADVTTSSLEAYRVYAAGVHAEGNVRVLDARRHYADAVGLDPTFGIAWFRLARLARSEGDMLAADSLLHRTLTLTDRMPERERLLVEAYQLNLEDDPGRAIEILERLIRRFPDEELAHVSLADIHYAQLDQRGALDVLQRAATAIPRSGLLQNQLGYAYLNQGRYPEAIAALTEYQRLHPGEANPLDSLAEVYLISGQPDEALERYGEALKLDPDFVSTRRGRAYALAMLGRYEEALAEIDVEHVYLQDRGVQLVDVEFLHAYLLSRVGRYLETNAAISEEVERALARDDYLAASEFEWLSAVMAMEQGHYDVAQQRAARMERFANRIPMPTRMIIRFGVPYFVGTAAAWAGNVDEARIQLGLQEAALDRVPVGMDPPAIIRELNARLRGEIALAEGRLDDAELAFRQGDPPIRQFFTLGVVQASVIQNNMPSRDWLARTRMARGDLVGAVAAYRDLLEPGIGSKTTSVLEPRYVISLARLLDRTGDRIAAAREYQRFLDLWRHADEGLPEVEEATSYLAGSRR